jgi:cytidylate kinase
LRGSDWCIHALKKCDLTIWLQTSLPKRIYRILKRYLSRKGEYDEDIKGMIGSMKYSAKYKIHTGSSSYSKIRDYIADNKINHITIKNKKQLREFLEELE